MKIAKHFAAVALLASISTAHSAIISIDADGFAAGTVLNNAFTGLGVTLSAFGSSTDGNVYARISALATTPDKVFGNSSAFDPLWIPGGRSLRIDFSGGTDFVSMDVIANDSSDRGSLAIFDSADVLLGSVNTGALAAAGDFETLSFNRGSRDIAYLVATGVGGDNVALDNARFNSVNVPEPSILALLGLGLAGLLASRRRNNT